MGNVLIEQADKWEALVTELREHIAELDGKLSESHTREEMLDSEMASYHQHQEELEGENKRLRGTLDKISTIRNRIVGRQAVNWSADIYPLVAALKEIGFEGLSFEDARAALAPEKP